MRDDISSASPSAAQTPSPHTLSCWQKTKLPRVWLYRARPHPSCPSGFRSPVILHHFTRPFFLRLFVLHPPGPHQLSPCAVGWWLRIHEGPGLYPPVLRAARILTVFVPFVASMITDRHPPRLLEHTSLSLEFTDLPIAGLHAWKR